MDSSIRFPATPGMPLFSLSPERVNTRAHTPTKYPDVGRASLDISPSKLFGHPEFGVPGDFGGKPLDLTDEFSMDNEFTFKSPFAKSESTFKIPSLPGSPTRHARAQSDVHSMVARFDTLNIKDPDEGRKKQAAALKRAEMGREEAEKEAKRLREELAEMKLEVDDYKSRETRVMKRLNSMTDELQSAKESKSHAQTLYEKEIRKARKEAFKASSSLVKLAEELKSARNTLRSLQLDLETERGRAARREQEAFNAQYQLAGVQEDLGAAQARLKIAEEEREALKTSLKEEEVARIAAEGRIALPPAEDEDDEFASPTKKRRSSCRRSITPPRMSLTGVQFTISEELEQLREELDAERRQRETVEEIVLHMNMECQFGCCSCKLAEQQGSSFVHDDTFEEEVRNTKHNFKGLPTPPESEKGFEHNAEESWRAGSSAMDIDHHIDFAQTAIQEDMAHSANLMTDEPSSQSAAQHDLLDQEVSPTTRPAAPPHHPIHEENPSTPQHPFRTTTTTTTIPLANHSLTTTDQPQPDYSSFATPTGLTRQQAIEQLRARRGRAKSIVTASGAGSTPATGKKAGLLDLRQDMQTPRRDISAASAPEMGKSVSRLGKRVVSK